MDITTSLTAYMQKKEPPDITPLVPTYRRAFVSPFIGDLLMVG